MNKIRKDLSNFPNEFYLHSEGNYVTIFRTAIINDDYIKKRPQYDGYAMICRTGFDMGPSQPCKIELPGIYSEFICGASMKIGHIDVEGFKKNNVLRGTNSDVYFTENPSYLNSITKFSIINNKTVVEINGTIQSNTVIILKLISDNHKVGDNICLLVLIVFWTGITYSKQTKASFLSEIECTSEEARLYQEIV